ncbi:oligoendopeptidase F [Hathewaya histolytica]|uniref:Oligopeptidase F n=1 Tax=Hathewaya histolytica TaxID=1498 RepID=A0A4U9RRP6_HATHI|nr:oligoendopeptidase F [Hathewaya histolytica]VTQ93543.1 oligoendopeptidase F [Hathewaya histolytica]
MGTNSTIKTRQEIDKKYKWAIENIYSSLDEFEKDYSKVKEEGIKLKEFQGKLHVGEELLRFLKKDEEVCRLADKLFVFSALKYDEDTTVTESQVIKKKMDSYMTELASIRAFFIPEILSIDNEVLEKEISRIPELETYRFYFKTVLEAKPHMLDKEKEELVAGISDSFGVPVNVFEILTSSTMNFPTIEDKDGKEFKLSDSNFTGLLKSKDRTLRKAAFEGAFGTYKQFSNTFATLMTSSMKNFASMAKTRNYKDSLEYSLKPNNIPTAVYYTTIDTINKNLQHLHKYIALKKRLLNLKEMHMYDIYMPIIEEIEDYTPYEEGVELVKKGLKPLGEEYLNVFQNGIDTRWVDVYENKGKKGGAYSWGTYDIPAYVHLNYTNHYNDVSMLAHEMGHSIHSHYSNKNQPYIYSNYSYFCAEVASTTNESLLISYLIDNEEDKYKKMFYIAAQLEQMRVVVFRQALFAEFELRVHEEIEKGNILSAEELCKMYVELNKKYYGDAIIVDEAIGTEWARIPQYYMDYYTYQYVTGFAAANSFSKAILEEGEEAIERYMNFLKSGSSDYSIELLKKAGVDMTSPKPLQDTMDIFAERLEMLEKLIND